MHDNTRPTLEHAGDHDDDRRSIAALVADVEAGFNDNDAETAVAHFAADAAATGVTGVQTSGWDALLDAHRVGFAGFLKDQHARYALDGLHFVRPDVAIAHKVAWATDSAGTPLTSEPAMRALYVLVKQHGRWWIAARANTLITPRHDEVLERQAIDDVVARLQHAQQHEQVDEFVGLFHPDATWVTGGGVRLIGRDAIAEFTQRVLPGAMKDSTATYEVVHVSLLRPDVAVVAVRQRQVSLDGQPLDGHPEGRPTYIMTKDASGQWQLSHGQNTQVAA